MAPIMPDNLTTKFIFLYLYVVICLYEFMMQGICIFKRESIQADILLYKYVKITLGFQKTDSAISKNNLSKREVCLEKKAATL